MTQAVDFSGASRRHYSDAALLLEPGAETQAGVFNFDLGDEAAPHYPVRIRWHNSLQEFDPLLRSRHILDDELIAATFGDFLKRVKTDLGGTQDG